jgi:predicted SAM-dependent methyltransferase
MFSKSSLKNTVAGYTAISVRTYFQGLGLRFVRSKGKRSRKSVIADYLRDEGDPKLHVGAGHNRLPGWLNTDFEPVDARIIFLDVTETFPFPNASFQYVFGEHLVEHVPYQHGLAMLGECHRILRPGGRIRLATPNLLKWLALFEPDKSPASVQFLQEALKFGSLATAPMPECFVLNNGMRAWGHQFVYDPGTLRAAVEASGFRNIKFYSAGQSEDPNLTGIEHHGKLTDEAYNLYETMVIEAEK